jgi:hypothetical protein
LGVKLLWERELLGMLLFWSYGVPTVLCVGVFGTFWEESGTSGATKIGALLKVTPSMMGTKAALCQWPAMVHPYVGAGPGGIGGRG